jgi:hypothetical protein
MIWARTACALGYRACRRQRGNVPQFITVENNVVEGYGRVFPNAWGISQGDGHDNTYIHNDVYDGYHAAIGICQCTSVMPASGGAYNNTISFNRVYNLLQGIMNDAGSLYIAAGNAVFTAAGNKILNNIVHDVNDASALDGSPARRSVQRACRATATAAMGSISIPRRD